MERKIKTAACILVLAFILMSCDLDQPTDKTILLPKNKKLVQVAYDRGYMRIITRDMSMQDSTQTYYISGYFSDKNKVAIIQEQR